MSTPSPHATPATSHASVPAASPPGATAPEPLATATVPAAGVPGGLNHFVLALVYSYPLDGRHGFHWPKPSESDWEGTTRDLVYGGRRLTRGDPQGRSYCCGLTFEVYVRALLAAAGGVPLPGVSADDLHELRLRFFGDSKAGERRQLAAFGLESLGFGRRLERLEDARAGDFVQLWRENGSGHSVIFINWIRRAGEIVGLTYWSTQSSTAGVGYCTEWIGPGGILPNELFVARADWPLRRP